MVAQNINRVDHVMYVARAENQVRYVDQLSKLCKTKFHGPVEKPEFGVRLYINWVAGLEVISPVSDTQPWSLHMKRHIEERGEGLLGIVFGVGNMDEARQHAQSLGYEISPLIENAGDEPYAAETVVMKETVVGEIINNLFVFAEVKLGPNPLT